MSDSDDDYDY